ncbi:MAG TPA: outer membrane beta-barrel protein [Flavipsychrobacter sp.]|nr:outer membrane beta-barrel protein [Flavipsychrobacter sp.]
MKKKAFFTISLCLCQGLSALAFHFHPKLSILTSYTLTKNYTDIEAGRFDVSNRNLNFGFEFTNKFYVSDNCFIETGFRYGQYKTVISAKNQLADHLDKPYPLSWERRFENLGLPILLGRDFITKNGRKGDMFIGVSAGILMTSYAKDQVSSSFPKNINNLDTVRSEISDDGRLPSFFFPTIDLGANYHPLKSLSRFSVGLLFSIQLNKTGAYSYQGTLRNLSKNEEYIYSLQHSMSFINCMLSLSYTFGKQKSNGKNSHKLDCIKR